MIPGVNIVGRKVSVASVNRAGGSRGVPRPQQAPKKIFRLQKASELLKIDLNAAEIITIEDYKHTQN